MRGFGSVGCCAGTAFCWWVCVSFCLNAVHDANRFSFLGNTFLALVYFVIGAMIFLLALWAPWLDEEGE